jgi:hypothetical protein
MIFPKVQADDVTVPGLTRFGVAPPPVTPIDKNPLGQWVPPPYVDAGVLSVQQFTLSTSMSTIGLDAHEHLILDNQGVETVQLSVDGITWYDFLPPGRVLVLDGHKGSRLNLRTASGECVVLVSTW